MLRRICVLSRNGLIFVLVGLQRQYYVAIVSKKKSKLKSKKIYFYKNVFFVEKYRSYTHKNEIAPIFSAVSDTFLGNFI